MARRNRVVMGHHVQRPKRRNIFRSLQSNAYWKCLLSTVLVHLCIAYAAWCHIHHYAYAAQLTFTYTHGPCAQGYSFIPIIFGIMLYAVYIMECWHTRAKFSKIKKESVGEATKYVRKMRISMPVVWWKSVCYHYVRRTKQVTRYRNGDVISATQVYYERVNSHNAGNIFLYDECGMKDISPSLVDLDRFPQTRVRISKGFVFANTQSANEFEEQRSHFFGENELRDDYMEVREGLEFADLHFVDDLIVYRGNAPPWYASSVAYWVLSVLLLSWPLRIFSDWRTAHIDYQVTKLFGTNYLSPSSLNYTGPLTRTSSMDSRELEMAMGNDYVIVPSYSEAILMDAVHFDEQRTPMMMTARPALLNNEHMMFANYGSTSTNRNHHRNRGGEAANNAVLQLTLSAPRIINKMRTATRSVSMNLFPAARAKRPCFSTSATPVPRVGQPNASGNVAPGNGLRPPQRSISIPGISSGNWLGSIEARQGEYGEMRPLIAVNEDCDEPPPPYEVALRMCAPLYSRLLRSASSLTSRLISHSNSREFTNFDTTTRNSASSRSPCRNHHQQQPCSSRDYAPF